MYVCGAVQWMPMVSCPLPLCLCLEKQEPAFPVSVLHHAPGQCTYREKPKHGRTVSQRSDGSDDAHARADGGARDAEQEGVVGRSVARVLSSWPPGAWHADAPSLALGAGSGGASRGRVALPRVTLSAYADAAHTEDLQKHRHTRGLGLVTDRGMGPLLGERWPQLCGLPPAAAIACCLLQQMTDGKPSLCSLSAIVAAHVADEHEA